MSYEPGSETQDMGVTGRELPVELEIEGLAAGGRGVARQGGQVWFVRAALPGDRVLAQPLQRRARYVEARTLRIVRRSAVRRDPACPVQDRCGGCPWMGLEESSQREWKRRLVQDALQRIAGIAGVEVDQPITVGGDLGYRNKVELVLGRDADARPVIGFHEAGGLSGVVDVTDCAVQHDSANRVLLATRRILLEEPNLWPASTYRREDPFRLVIRRSWSTGALLVAVRETRAEFPAISEFTRRLTVACPELRSVARLRARPGRRGGTRVEAIHGPDWIEERVGELTFRLPASSFLQVNTEVGSALVHLVTSVAAPGEGVPVLDLYGGVGSIGLHLARRGARVTVCEADRTAVVCGRQAIRAHRLTGVRFYHGDVRGFLEAEEPPAGAGEIIVANPPRDGLGRGVSQAILARRPARVILVSCDPPTMARDLRALTGGDMRLNRVSPLDMFPQTSHVETVAVLDR